MDQVVNDRSRANEKLERIVSALGSGIIFLDADRQITWIDDRTRARLNGGLAPLAETLRVSDVPDGMSCSVSIAEVDINGEAATVCLIKERDAETEQGFDIVAAVESALADTSWFTRTIIEKLKALRQTKRLAPRTSDLEALSDREREVLGLICEGRSDAQMSAILGLSHNTIRNHIAALYRKIGVNRRTNAVIWARERGITAHDALSARRRTGARPKHPPIY
jgi:DNA-binding CsgD family transcriptional regulator